MSALPRTVIVTGVSQGIGAAVARAFLDRGYNLVGTSRNASRSAAVKACDRVALIDGDIGDPATAAAVVDVARSRFGAIDVLVNNAGIFTVKPFPDYSVRDVKALLSTNVEGFVYITQHVIKQMLEQRRGGHIVSITAALARNPQRGTTASVPMITKGGLETITAHLAMEYAHAGIRVNAVAPGLVYTPLHRDTPQEVMDDSSPMGRASSVEHIAEAVIYLAEAEMVTGEILDVDGGMHLGRW